MKMAAFDYASPATMEEAGRFARIAFRQREDHVRRAKPCADARVSARCTRAAGRIEARLMSALPPKADIGIKPAKCLL